VKEKVIAARQSEVEHILLPEGNRKDWAELPDDMVEGLAVHFVANYAQVFDVCFPGHASVVNP
jgi:ATP-dependent Lon protease